MTRRTYFATALASLLAVLAPIPCVATQTTPASTELELEVVVDTGKGVPAAPYFAHLISGESNSPEQLQGVRFPIVSPLRNAVLRRDQAAVFSPGWMATPIFLLGTDTHSAQWLELNHERLVLQGAMGVVIDAPNVEAYKRLQARADAYNLLLAPMQGTWLQERLLQAQVNAYPVLIQSDGRAVQRLGELD